MAFVLEIPQTQTHTQGYLRCNKFTHALNAIEFNWLSYLTSLVSRYSTEHTRGHSLVTNVRSGFYNLFLSYLHIYTGISSRYKGSWGQHGDHLGPTRPRWAPCWPHELCYLGLQSKCYHFLIILQIHGRYNLMLAILQKPRRAMQAHLNDVSVAETD